MYFDWIKIIKRFVTTIFLLCLCSDFGIAQKNDLSAKRQTSITKATDAFKRGDFNSAKTILRKILLIEPHNVTAHTLLGAIADRENDLKTAESHFAQAAKFSPKSSETHNNYGAILVRLNRKAEAAKQFKASLAANPNQPSALINLAQIHVDENNLLAARQLFEKVRTISPSAEILRALILISLKLNDKENVVRDYIEYSAIVKNFVLLKAAQVELGTALLESDLISEAIAELDSALRIAPNDVDAIVLLSRAHLKKKDIKNAGRMLESAVARGVDDAKIYAALADVYEAGGYYENAIPAMRLAIERDSRNEAYRFRYGLLLVDTKAPAAAIIRLSEAIKDFPGSARLWLGLGIAQYNDSKTADAQQSLKKALELDSRLVPALAYLAAIEDEIGKSTEAASNYERALALDGKSAVLNYLLAETLLKSATVDTQRVEKHLQRAIATDAKLAAAHLALGRLYSRQKRFAEAAAALEKTVQLQATRAEAYYQLGQVYIRLKRVDEAKAALSKFKELSELEKTQTKTDRNELVRRLANVKF